MKQRNSVFVLILINIGALFACRAPDFANESQTIFSAPDGNTVTNLLWSPSGDRLGITTFDGYNDSGKIYVLDILSGESRLLFSGSDISADAWSPIHEQIAVTTLSGIVIVDVTSLTTIPDFMLSGKQPTWSSDGTKIVYSDYTISNPAGVSRFELKMYDFESDSYDVITQVNSTLIPELAWSPDGKTLATALCSKSCNIFLIDIQSQNMTQITQNVDGADSFNPSWSPDSAYIVYLNLPLNDTNPMPTIRDIKNDCKTELRSIQGTWRIAWAPSGEYMVFTYNNNSEVRLLNLKEMFWDDFLSKMECNN